VPNRILEFLRTWRVLVIFFVGSFVLMLILDKVLPYGFEHFRQRGAMELKSIVSSWKKSGEGTDELLSHEKTNNDRHIFLHTTDFQANGTAYTSIIRFEAGTLRGKGFLVATTNAEVFWVSKKGKIERLK
jgi:hypothetical protein